MAEGTGSETFNPQVPFTAGQPYFWTKPTGKPEVNTSGETLLKGAASAAGEGIRGFNAAYEKGIQDQVYAAVDPIRDQYLNQLHEQDQFVQGHDTPDPTGHNNIGELKALPRTLENFDSARANGKLSQTDYDARLNSIAKELRAKYPGYREYVDEQVRRVTGRDPANQYIRSVIQDIDSYIAKKNEGKNKILELAKTGLRFSDGNIWYQKAQAGMTPKDEATFLGWLNENESRITAQEETKRRLDITRESMGVDLERDKITARRAYDNFTGGFYSSHLDSMFTQAGFPTDYQEILNRMRRGQSVSGYKTEDLASMRAFGTQYRAFLVTERMKELSTSYFGDTKINMIDALGGPEEARKMVEDDTKSYFDPLMESLGKGEWDLVGANKKVLEAAASDKGKTIMSDKQYKDTMLVAKFIKDTAPELFPQFMASMSQIASPEFAAKFMHDAGKAATDPNNPATLKSTLEEAKARKVNNTAYYDKMVSMFRQIPDRKTIPDDVATNLIKYAFSNENKGLIGMFDKDKGVHFQRGESGRMEATPWTGKNFIPGQQTLFDWFSQKGMVDRVMKLSQQGHPELWQNYQDWATSDFRYVLDKHLAYPGPTEHSTVSYSEGTGRFTTKLTDQRGKTTPGGIAFQKELDQLSGIMKNLHYMYSKNEKMDPDAALWGLLESFNPQPGSTAFKMMQAMRAAHSEQ